MVDRPKTEPLDQLVDEIDDELDDDNRLGSVVYAAGNQSYGPLLLIPALIALAPTGAIPGVPAACSLIITLVAVQMIFGARQPWLPKRVLNIKLDQGLAQKAVNTGRPAMRFLSNHIHERWTFLVNRPAKIVSGLVMIGLSALMVPLEIVPFAVAAPAAAIALLAIAVTARDGIVMALGLVGAVMSSAFGVWLISTTD